MQSLPVVSRELSEVAARAEGSVVNVQAHGSCGATGFSWASDLVVTTARALDGGGRVEVGLQGRRLPAKLLGVHLQTDLAVLRVEGELDVLKLSALPWAAPESLALAELVLALARPGDRVRARLGIVSALGEKWRLAGGAEFERYIESDLSPAPGFSGGPLLRANGELIGLNNARLSRGVLLTLPAAGVSRIVESLVAHGRVPRAHLGVAVQSVRLPRPLAEAVGRASGLLVLSVEPGSAAERGGLMLGDLLLELGGRPLGQVGELQAALGEATLGTEIPLQLVRGGDRRQLAVLAEERS